MSNNDDGGGNEGPGAGLGEIPEYTCFERIVGGIAGVAVISSLLTIALYFSNPVAIAAGAGSAILGPYAYMQQRKLSDIRALKETHEALAKEVETLKFENRRLRAGVDDLSDTVKRLGDVEDALDVITQTQGQSVEAFAQQVEENRAVLNSMEKNLKSNVLQNLFSVVMGSDTDGDLTIDESEIDGLIQKLDAIKGVRINRVLFRETILKHGGSLDAIMAIVKNLIEEGGDDKPVEEQIFVLTDI